MRVGLDFDNTIVCYDQLFHKVALELGAIPADLPQNKVLVRDHLRRIGQEDVWTEMQGTVYGARMDEAEPYPGVIDALRQLKAAGVELFIVSHKTRTPFRGPAYDLHQAARHWVETVLLDEGKPLVEPEHVFFRPTKSEKWQQIADCGCQIFIDDLPEILKAAEFPAAVRAVLFDPERHHQDEGLETVTDWAQIPALVLG